MRNRAFILAMLFIAAIALVSCGGGNRGRQGQWYTFKYSTYQDNALREIAVRIQVTGSYYSEGISDELQVRVEYDVENAGDQPLVISWEDKFIEGQNGGLHDPFGGNSSPELKPGEGASNLYVRYLLPRSVLKDVSSGGLWWGRHSEDDAGLRYRIRLNMLAG